MTDRSVIWITTESVRHDHAYASGLERVLNLARSASTGRSSDSCFSHDIWTRSSSASILTGQTPSAHQTWTLDAKLPDEIRTIPEAFRDAGYRTACVTANGQLSRATGLDRGFDDFQYLNRSTLAAETRLRDLAGWVWNIWNHSGGVTGDVRKHSFGYIVNQLSYRHIDKTAAADDPLFLYVHHNDTHHAYVPPVAWRNRVSADLPMPVEDAVELALEMSDNLHENIAAADPFTEKQWEALGVLYDTSIAYVDQLVGELLDHVQQKLDDPVMVVTADHGELFGERGLLAHMLVTNAAVSNVPLVTVGLDGLPEGGLIQHADVMKMICSDLPIDHPVPAGQDIRTHPREFAVTQRGGVCARNRLEALRECRDDFDSTRFHRDDLTSIRTAEWRYQTSGERSELFALPDETEDVSDENPDVVRRLDEHAQTWLDSVGEPIADAGTAEFDEGATEHLRDLGYLQ